MMSQPDEVSVEEAYASALIEIGRLQQRLILGQALIARLKKEGNRGPTDKDVARDVGSGDSSHDFSD